MHRRAARAAPGGCPRGGSGLRAAARTQATESSGRADRGAADARHSGSATRGADSPQGARDDRQRLTLVAAVLGSAVATIDATIVNVALPAIQRDLGGGLATQQWVSNAYLLTLGSLILVGGSLGDLYGERRIFTIGVVGFGVVSVACALAPSIEVLVAGRALQ